MRNVRADSLEQVLATLPATQDSTRSLVLSELAIEYAPVFPEKAKAYSEKALSIAQILDFKRGKAYASLSLGIYFWFQNLYDNAFRHFTDAATHFQELGAKQEVARVYTHIGNVHLRTARYEKAMECYNQSIAIAEELGDKERIAYNISSRAQVFRRLYGDYDRALQDLSEGARLFREAGNMTRVSINTNIMGAVYSDKKDYTRSLEYHLKALAMERLLPPSPHIVETLIDIATTLNILQRPVESLPYLREAEREAVRGNARHIRMYLYTTLAETHAALRQFDEAYRAQTLAFQLKDTVFANDRTNAIAEMQARFDLANTQHALERSRAESHRERLLLYASFLGSALILVSAVWFWLLYRRARRAEALLLSKQAIIEKQSSDIQEANTLLHEQNIKLHALNEEKNEFLGIAVHDLKNPLSAIYLTTDLITESLKAGKMEKIAHYAASVRSATNQMLSIVGNLLDINKLEQGAWKLVPEPILSTILHDIIEAHSLAAAAKSISLTLELELAQPTNTWFWADETAFRHIMDNLLSNAIKYTPLKGSVVVRVSEHNSLVHIAVQDTGQGFTEKDKQQMFGKFARLSARPTAGESSTGLGLSIVKKLADSMHAHLWCESEYGNGATFILEFPQHNSAQ